MSGTILLTGASTGIGRVLCQRLLDQGREVVALSRRGSGLQHPRLHEHAVDLADAAATAQAAAEVARQFDVSGFVHNAGAMRPALLADVQPEDLPTLSQLHIGSAITLMQAVLPGMEQTGFGRVVLMSSRGALGLATRTNYSATKAGMIGMARTWALELAPKGITVNVVAPGPIQTPMFYDVVPAGSERESKLAANIPVGRIGRPDDVTRAVMFFADPANSFVTGQTLYVCGGASVGTLTI